MQSILGHDIDRPHRILSRDAMAAHAHGGNRPQKHLSWVQSRPSRRAKGERNRQRINHFTLPRKSPAGFCSFSILGRENEQIALLPTNPSNLCKSICRAACARIVVVSEIAGMQKREREREREREARRRQRPPHFGDFRFRFALPTTYVDIRRERQLCN